MTVSGISGGAGLGAVWHRHHWQNVSGTGGQASDTSPTGQAASAGTQATPSSSRAEAGFFALLGGFAAAGVTPDSAETSLGQQEIAGPPPPPPGQGSGEAGSFGSNLANLLHSVLSGDLAGAQSAATALQDALIGTDSQPATSASSTTAVSTDSTATASSTTAPGVSTSTSTSTSTATAASPDTATSTASTLSAVSGSAVSGTSPSAAASTTSTSGTDSTQSTFMTALKTLLSAVQNGDATASQTAAATLMDELKSRAEAFQSQLAGMGGPPLFERPGVGIGDVQSAYSQWS